MVRSQQPMDMTIGKLAAAGNVGVETIRFYQRRGLLTTPKKHVGVRH
ncbi:MerR family DNA-binding transcriptional regulator, partial [Shinella sp.]